MHCIVYGFLVLVIWVFLEWAHTANKARATYAIVIAHAAAFGNTRHPMRFNYRAATLVMWIDRTIAVAAFILLIFFGKAWW